MASSTVTAPELTQEQVQRILVKPLEAASAFLAAGPRIFDVTAAGVVRIPKLVSMTAPSWHGENELSGPHEGDERPSSRRLAELTFAVDGPEIVGI